jgi:effector-binding domain-containing protein
LTGRLAETERISVTTLPACRAATAIVRGRYERLSAAAATLETWVDAAGVSRSGPLRILYLQFGAPADLRLPDGYVVDRADDYVTELQLPIG